jgi:SAM-dependent methyltransferase
MTPGGLPPRRDAYGQVILRYFQTGTGQEIVERDDGFIEAMLSPAAYFAPFRRWPPVERRALRYVRGRVLDAGCGAGRVALELQDRGRKVVGIDISPLAVQVARKRGVKDARVLPFHRVDATLGRFDTVLLYGNNFGLFANRSRGRRLLRRLLRLTTEKGRIVGGSVDPYGRDDPAHRAYHELNRNRGRLPGQLRLRIRHRDSATPWFDYLIVSPAELEDLLAGTGWHVHRLVQDETPYYVAVLEKDGSNR